MPGAPRRYRRPRWLHVIGPMTLTLSVTACGIEPYRAPDAREEGPGRGLFTGSPGEWVIYREIGVEDEKFGANQSADSEPANPQSQE